MNFDSIANALYSPLFQILRRNFAKPMVDSLEFRLHKQYLISPEMVNGRIQNDMERKAETSQWRLLRIKQQYQLFLVGWLRPPSPLPPPSLPPSLPPPSPPYPLPMPIPQETNPTSYRSPTGTNWYFCY